MVFLRFELYLLTYITPTLELFRLESILFYFSIDTKGFHRIVWGWRSVMPVQFCIFRRFYPLPRLFSVAISLHGSSHPYWPRLRFLRSPDRICVFKIFKNFISLLFTRLTYTSDRIQPVKVKNEEKIVIVLNLNFKPEVLNSYGRACVNVLPH